MHVMGSEITLLLRGIERLRKEMAHVNHEAHPDRVLDLSKRIQTLQSCLFNTLWPEYGTREEDKRILTKNKVKLRVI
jgi:hypothetical protein